MYPGKPVSWSDQRDMTNNMFGIKSQLICAYFFHEVCTKENCIVYGSFRIDTENNRLVLWIEKFIWQGEGIY